MMILLSDAYTIVNAGGDNCGINMRTKLWNSPAVTTNTNSAAAGETLLITGSIALVRMINITVFIGAFREDYGHVEIKK